jgi:flagellar hook-length control protein FliK
VAINTNALSLGGTPPAKSNLHLDADQGSQASSTPTAASQDSVSDGPVQSGGTAQQTPGPSAQTRANARATRAPAANSSATGSTSGTDSATATADASANFGSVMASALGRSAATTATPPPAKVGASATDSTPAPAQPAAQAATDAVAWIAQALAPPAAAAAMAQPITTPGTAKATGGNGARIGAVTGAAVAAAAPTTAGVVLPPGTPTGPAANTDLTSAAAEALRTRSAAEQVPQMPNAPTADVQAQAQAAPSATTLGSLNALADVQKLIAGMTSANSAGTDQDSNEDLASAPAPHAATAAASTDGTQAAVALQAAALTRTDSTQGSATLSIQAPVGSAAFADEVSARVTGLAQSGITQAQLQLSPADLGPVQVHITLQAGQASVWFGANHADTRAALEQSLPRLRELFAGAGLPLTDSGVFREPPQQQSAQSPPAPGSARITGSDTSNAATVTQLSNIRLALLDTYA